MDFKKLTKIFLWVLFLSLFTSSLFYGYKEWNNEDLGEKYVILSEGKTFYCNRLTLRKKGLVSSGYKCNNNKYFAVEFRSSHVIMYRGRRGESALR